MMLISANSNSICKECQASLGHSQLRPQWWESNWLEFIRFVQPILLKRVVLHITYHEYVVCFPFNVSDRIAAFQV